MPRLRHKVTKVVVSVSDEMAERLKADYEPVDEKPTGSTRPRAK